MDSRVLSPNVIVRGAVTPEGQSLLNTPCQLESGGTILLQLLEFKIDLLEAVEELHIRRDAEGWYEEQISKVVLEKQELEWKKESLQHQIETATNQHAQSVIDIQKQFQATIRHTEQEKGRYQAITELKEKEIRNLKEEMKSLQLLKYNLEKKTNDLEQKIALQIQSKDSHLNQMREVEKHFKALSRQCTTVKKAHEKLEQNVDEAMRINKKLTASNKEHEATIEALKKELEEVNAKLIKAKLSSVQHDKAYRPPTHTEQHLQELRHSLSMENEMNKRLRDEYAAVRSEKQELMKSMQHTQQLLLCQTQTVSRLELQLQTQEEQYKVFKQEHELMQEKCKAMEDKVAQLIHEQQDFQTLKEAHDDLQQKHTELSAQVKMQVHNIHEMFPTLAEETRERPPDELQPIAMQHVFGSQQNSAVSQNKILDCLEDTTAMNKLDSETGGLEAPNPHVKSQAELQDQCQKLFSIQSTKNPLGLSEKTSSDDILLNKQTSNYNRSERMSNQVSDLTCTTFHQAGYELANSEISDTISESSVIGINKSNSACRSSNDFQTEDRKFDDRSASMTRADYCGIDKANEESNNREEMERNTNHQRKTEDVLENVYAGELREIPNSQTADRVNSEECCGKGEHESKTETTECIDGGEEKGKTETQIDTQTTHDKMSNTQSDTDFMEKIVVCETTCYQKDMEKVAYNSPMSTNKGQLLQDFSSPTNQNLSGCTTVMHKVQNLCQDQVQTNAASIKSSPIAAHRVEEKTPEDRRMDEPTAKLSNPLIQSLGSLTIPTLTEPGNITSDMTLTDDMDVIDTNDKFGKTMDDTKIVSHSQSTIEQANRLMETCETASHLEIVIYEKGLKMSNQDNTADSKTSESVLLESILLKGGNDESVEADASKCHKLVVKETLGDVKELSLPETYKDCGGAIKETVLSPASTDSILHPNVQNFPVPEKNICGPVGLLAESPCTTFFKSQHSKVPLVTTRAADLFNAFGVSGYTAFAMRPQLGEQSVFRESYRETSTADGGRISMSVPSCPVSSLSSTQPWQLPSGSSRLPVPSLSPRSEHKFEPLCSQEEQYSFRSQIYKIEQFLKTERLHLSKRRRTDN
ncbi:uncharacterized protein LOC129181530 isoform X2 [Dunckerocampus dactyliophorus]|nr:uncharacterized protein LOC129181530 isoform X2 [Dunckerocampus dactyliophorus]XP_054632825.1 uncharacterized protein LOC129181530 isoform X2 [Dunckerocampus dactyliophorus]